MKMKNLLKNKKAYTLAEVLITLSIIGVVAAITIPLLINNSPDKEKLAYLKALAITQNVVSEMTNDSNLYREPVNIFADGEQFCNNFVDIINTLGAVNCSAEGTQKPSFTTIDGTRWFNMKLNKKIESDTMAIISVIPNNFNIPRSIAINSIGKISIPDGITYKTEREWALSRSRLTR